MKKWSRKRNFIVFGSAIFVVLVGIFATVSYLNSRPPEIPQEMKTLTLPYGNGNQHIEDCSSKDSLQKTYCSAENQPFAVVSMLTASVKTFSDNLLVIQTLHSNGHTLQINYTGLSWLYPAQYIHDDRGSQIGGIPEHGKLVVTAFFDGKQVSFDQLWGSSPPSFEHHLSNFLGGFMGPTGLEHFCPLEKTVIQILPEDKASKVFEYKCIQYTRDHKLVLAPIWFPDLCSKAYPGVDAVALNENGGPFGWDCYSPVAA